MRACLCRCIQINQYLHLSHVYLLYIYLASLRTDEPQCQQLETRHVYTFVPCPGLPIQTGYSYRPRHRLDLSTFSSPDRYHDNYSWWHTGRWQRYLHSNCRHTHLRELNALLSSAEEGICVPLQDSVRISHKRHSEDGVRGVCVFNISHNYISSMHIYVQ